jgi:CheY-like chemotaxis protein
VNGAGALLLVPALRPDLILLDYQMERMDGMEFLRSLRKMDPPVRDTPVIGMSSVEEGRILGDLASTFLKKPFQKEQLAEAIRKLGIV